LVYPKGDDNFFHVRAILPLLQDKIYILLVFFSFFLAFSIFCRFLLFCCRHKKSQTAYLQFGFYKDYHEKKYLGKYLRVLLNPFYFQA